MNKIENYAKLITAGTKYAVRMKRLSDRIFGEVHRPTTNRSLNVMKRFSEKPIHKRPEIVEYYPRLKETHFLMEHLRDYGLYRDEHMDFKKEQQRVKALKGKRIWLPHRVWKEQQENK